MRRIALLAAAWITCIAGVLAGCSQSGPQSHGQSSAQTGLPALAASDDDSFRFVIMGDRCGGHQKGAWEAAIEQVNLLKPDFVICVGDLIEGYDEDAVAVNAMWDEVDGQLRKLDAPFFYCGGNHDLTNDVQLEVYLKRHGVGGKSYYSFDYRGCHFVVLDSTTANRLSDSAKEQFDWLEKDLAKARDAKHVFLFYHHPKFEGEHFSKGDNELWARLMTMVPKDKVTIFNGHWHQLDCVESDGVASWVLGSTAAAPRGTGRNYGGFQMFAHVAVRGGKPSVALLPLGEVLPLEYARETSSAAEMVAAAGRLSIPFSGGQTVFKQTNPLRDPLRIRVSWDAPQWEILAEPAELEIPPGGSGEIRLTCKPAAADAGRPIFMTQYDLVLNGKKVQMGAKVSLGMYAAVDIPRMKPAIIDGDLTEWQAITPLRVAAADRVFLGGDQWTGEKDASYRMWTTTDGERLFVALDVSDDQICAQKDAKIPCMNDAFELFWDVRPQANRDGKTGKGTGQMIFVLPAQGDKLIYEVAAAQKPFKTSLQTAFKLRDGGYTVELSVPLKDLGMEQAVATGEGINLELQLDDRDEADAKAGNSFLSTGGTRNAHMSTAGYARGTFVEGAK